MKIKNNNLVKLIANHSFLGISSNLIRIFLGIILLQLGFPLVLVISILIVEKFLNFIPYLFIDNFIKKFGLKKTLIIGVLFHCLLYFVLSKVSFSWSWIVGYLFVRAFINSFYIFLYIPMDLDLPSF